MARVRIKSFKNIIWKNWKGGFVLGIGIFWGNKNNRPFNDLIIGLGFWELRIKLWRNKQKYPVKT